MTSSTGLLRARVLGSRALIAAVFVAALVYFLLPFFWLIVSSTKTNGALSSTWGLWFADHNAFWENVVSVFTTNNGVASGLSTADRGCCPVLTRATTLFRRVSIFATRPSALRVT